MSAKPGKRYAYKALNERTVTIARSLQQALAVCQQTPVLTH